ncbi:MAG: alpha/beta hydrolase, partial [Gemmatimonadota bacterium]|nr:alpha/beta hydrolase [Gemmatimonadota bacterium]
SSLAYRASPAAHAALVGDQLATVTRDSVSWTFTPVSGSGRSDTRLLFFPGALVDPASYAPLAMAVARAGFTATILMLPRRGAFGGADDPRLLARARTLIRRQNGLVRWVVAGHSRGAVVATQLAAERPAELAGLVIIGSSHPRDVSLAPLTIQVTKIVGTRDGLASPDEVRANQHLLPPSTHWVWIEGGNHSQFGWYGFQPGDRFARVSRGEQQAAMIRQVIAALRRVPD